jgi:hypothetical protein
MNLSELSLQLEYTFIKRKEWFFSITLNILYLNASVKFLSSSKQSRILSDRYIAMYRLGLKATAERR